MPVKLVELVLADPPEAWASLGFSVGDGGVALGGVRLRLGAAGQGIARWALSGLPGAVAEIDGLPTAPAEHPGGDDGAAHDNGAIGIDHVVVVTPDLERTTAALGEHGMTPRRIRKAGDVRQAFRRLGPAILEVVQSPRIAPGPARFWGLTLIARDLDAFVARLGPERITEARDAVQPGRRIATLRRAAGLSMPVAVMDPDPPREGPGRR